MNLLTRKNVPPALELSSEGSTSTLPTPVRDRSRDKALLIGIEYRWHPGYEKEVAQLSNPHRDVEQLKEYLVAHEGYIPENITILKDGVDDPLMEPSRANILREIDLFVSDVKEGDRRVFFFGGHGTQLLNRTGSELDGKDEAILTCRHHGWPVDEKDRPLPNDLDSLDSRLSPENPNYQKLKGVIVDNELRRNLVNRLPAGSQLVAFFDTCHSATMLDLDSLTWKRRATNVVSAVPKGYKVIRRNIRSPTISQFSPTALVPKSIPGKKFVTRSMKRATPTRSKSWVQKGALTVDSGSEPVVISFSSAQDNQTTSDVSGITMVSVMINYLRRESSEERNCTPRDLEVHLCQELERNRVQTFSLNPRVKKFTPALLQRALSRVKKMQVPTVCSLDDQVLKKPLRL